MNNKIYSFKKEKPANSFGWLFILSFVVILFLVPSILLVKIQLPFEQKIINLLPSFIIGGGIGSFFLIYVIIFFTMEYTCTEEQLIIKCGWYKKIIKYEQIKNVSIENLFVNPLADTQGFIKFPGYALGNVDYLDRGRIYMCATRVNKNILLLYLKNGEKVGITPKNLEEFKEFLIEKA
ncbi:PH domain-containing protein, partial [Caldicellulosiruptoraceae bacterium PP1]